MHARFTSPKPAALQPGESFAIKLA